MQYRVVFPISHSGQRIEPGTIVSDSERFGTQKKSELAIARLLAGGRVVPAPGAPGKAPVPIAEPTDNKPEGKQPGKAL